MDNEVLENRPENENQECVQTQENVDTPQEDVIVQQETEQVVPTKKNRKKTIIIAMSVMCAIVVAVAVLIATHVICIDHDFSRATCTEPKICKYCKKEEGAPTGHDWLDATCSEPKTCVNCEETRGEAKGHVKGSWSITKEPTLTEKGQETISCMNCNKVVDRRTVEEKTPAVKGRNFNFTDNEIVAYINQETELVVESSGVDVPEEGITFYTVTTKTGETGFVFFNHEGELDGKIAGIQTYFGDTYDEETASVAVGIWIGSILSPDFSVDDAINYAAHDKIYAAGGMKAKVVTSGYYIAPAAHF